MEIKSLQVSPIKRDKIRISWRFSKTLEDFHNFKFVLERSENSDEGFTPVVSFNHITEYVDTFYYRRLWKTLFYRIKIIDLTKGTSTYSILGNMSLQPNLEALEIIRRQDILLRNKRHGIGVPIAVFAKKKIGPTCNCWDANKQRVRTSSCDDCFGSHIEGGFYSPTITWANFSPNAKMTQIPQWGEMEPNEKRIFMGNYPIASPGDLIYNPADLTMYTVEKIETSDRRGVLLHQIISASFLDRNSVVYSLLDKHDDLEGLLKDEAQKIRKS